MEPFCKSCCTIRGDFMTPKVHYDHSKITAHSWKNIIQIHLRICHTHKPTDLTLRNFIPLQAQKIQSSTYRVRPPTIHYRWHSRRPRLPIWHSKGEPLRLYTNRKHLPHRTSSSYFICNLQSLLKLAFPVRLIVVLIIPFLCDKNVTIGHIYVTYRHDSSRHPQMDEIRKLITDPHSTCFSQAEYSAVIYCLSRAV